MQQTRIDQGLPYYLRFVKLFPDVFTLASAHEDEILHAWQGLGYYSRARNMHETAKFIVNQLQGQFPKTYYDLLKLKGIGEYTAAAISSICFNEQVPAIDGNVSRVISRLFDINIPVDKAEGKKLIREISQELIPKANPSVYNQAMMDLGAGICLPRNPNCPDCPIINKCAAFKNKTVAIRPIKVNKTKQRARFFNYLVFEYQDYTWIRKRIENDIWKGLFEFPMIETSQREDNQFILTHDFFKSFHIRLPVEQIEFVEMDTHILSHQLIYSRFIQIKLNHEIESETLIKIRRSELSNFALPKLIDNYLTNK